MICQMVRFAPSPCVPTYRVSAARNVPDDDADEAGSTPSAAPSPIPSSTIRHRATGIAIPQTHRGRSARNRFGVHCHRQNDLRKYEHRLSSDAIGTSDGSEGPLKCFLEREPGAGIRAIRERSNPKTGCSSCAPGRFPAIEATGERRISKNRGAPSRSPHVVTSVG